MNGPNVPDKTSFSQVDADSKSTLPGILKVLHAQRSSLAEMYAVASIGVFGSVVRNEVGESSDVDLLVEFSQPPTLFQFVRLQRHLSRLLGMPVDLVMKSSLKPEIGERILSEVVNV